MRLRTAAGLVTIAAVLLAVRAFLTLRGTGWRPPRYRAGISES
jgi:hypothetical protein